MSEEAVIKYINAPLTEETVKDLHAGDVVRISGYIYTARDSSILWKRRVIAEGLSGRGYGSLVVSAKVS